MYLLFIVFYCFIAALYIFAIHLLQYCKCLHCGTNKGLCYLIKWSSDTKTCNPSLSVHFSIEWCMIHMYWFHIYNVTFRVVNNDQCSKTDVLWNKILCFLQYLPKIMSSSAKRNDYMLMKYAKKPNMNIKHCVTQQQLHILWLSDCFNCHLVITLIRWDA